jgi:undecaprenyl-diphosphatase
MLIVLISGGFSFHLEPIVHIDQLILEWFAARRTVALDQFFACVSWAGSSLFLLPVIVTHAVILAIRKHIREAIVLAGSFVGAGVLAHVVKLVIARPRPNLFPAVIEVPTGFSFPSSHSVQITAFVIAQLLLMKILTGSRWIILLNLLGGSLIVLVCLSRLYLQVHFPTDVVAGFLTAFLWVVGLASLLLPDHHVRAIYIDGWRVEKGKLP